MLPNNGVKPKYRKNYHMTTEEVKLLFLYGSKWSYKFQLLISLCAFRGLRISEALAINYKTDFSDPNFSRLTIREAKTNKIRVIPLIPAIQKMIKHYIYLNKDRLSNGFLFPYYSSKKKTPFMNVLTAEALFSKLRQKIGKDHPSFLDKYLFITKTGKSYNRYRIGFHSLRRWFETTIFNKTESVYIVKELMDYTDFKVLESYLNNATIKERESEILDYSLTPILQGFKHYSIGQTKLYMY